MKLLITGATGLIGTEILELCKQNSYEVHYLTTNKEKIENKPGIQGFYWNPEIGEIDEDCLEGVDKIIHLAGASVAQRWTEKNRKEIIASRIKSTDLLRKLLEKKESQVTQIISASAIGIYPHSISKLYDEDTTEYAEDFLGQVVQEWESEVEKIKELGIGVSIIRIGLVLSDKGGFLSEVKKPIQYFVGSSLGSGNQWQSWIHIEDLARIFLFVTEKELIGVFNGVAPNPIKQKNMIKSIAYFLKKPIILPPVPGFVLKLALGEMSEMVLSSQLVVSKRWEKEGFIFRFTQLDGALENLLKTKK